MRRRGDENLVKTAATQPGSKTVSTLLRVAGALALVAMQGLGCSQSDLLQLADLRRPGGLAYFPTRVDPSDPSGETLFGPRVYAPNGSLNLVRAFSFRFTSTYVESVADPLRGPVRFFPLDINVGQFPTIARTFEGTQMMAVLNEGSRDVSLIDAETELEVDWYPSREAGFAVLGDSASAGVTRISFDLVDEVNVAVERVALGNLIVGDEPERERALSAIEGNPTATAQTYGLARLYVTQPEVGAVGMFGVSLSPPEPGDDKVWLEETVELPASAGVQAVPDAMALSRDAATLYVADAASARLFAIDVATGAVRESPASALPAPLSVIRVVPELRYKDANPGEGRRPLTDNPELIYAIDRVNQQVLVIDPVTLTPIRLRPSYKNGGYVGIPFVGEAPVDLAFSDTVMVYGNCVGQVAFVILANAELTTLDVGGCLLLDEPAEVIYEAGRRDDAAGLLSLEEPRVQNLWFDGDVLRQRPAHWFFDASPDGPGIETPTWIATTEEGATPLDPPTFVDDDGRDLDTDGVLLEGLPYRDGRKLAEGFGIVINDGYTRDEVVTVTYEGEVPLAFDARITSAKASLSGNTVTLSEKGVSDLAETAVAVGDLVEIARFGDRRDDPACPRFYTLASFSGTTLTLAETPDATCHPASAVVKVRVATGFAVVGSQSGYLGRAFEDGVQRLYPEGATRDDFAIAFALTREQPRPTRATGDRIRFVTSSGLAPGISTLRETTDVFNAIVLNYLPAEIQVVRNGAAPNRMRLLVSFSGSDSAVLMNPFDIIDGTINVMPPATAVTLR